MSFNMTTFKYLLLIRTLMGFVSLGSFVPDETWQSVEVAHNIVFGNGHLTWEWEQGIRSYFHPCFFASVFYILKWSGLDHPELVVILPKILQGAMSAVGDLCIVQVFGIVFKDKKKGKMFAIVYATNWFMLYASSRTLINTFETALTNLALRLYVENQSLYVFVIAESFMARPTTAIFWLPLVIYDVLWRSSLKKFFTKMIPSAIMGVLIVVFLDSGLYGSLTLAPWNFLRINLLQNISEQYGTEPWHWYFTNFMPALFCGYGLYPFICGLFKNGLNNESNSLAKILALSLVFSLISYSKLGHKEHRFIMPLIPLMLAFMVSALNSLTKPLKAFCAVNVVLALYLSLFHQTGPHSVMRYLYFTSSSVKGVLFLTPCHNMPFYSHMHYNVPMRFLECPPDLTKNPDHQEEDKVFYRKPGKWLDENDIANYSHIVFYEGLERKISGHHKLQNFHLCAKFWHTHFPDERTSPYVLIHCRNDEIDR